MLDLNGHFSSAAHYIATSSGPYYLPPFFFLSFLRPVHSSTYVLTLNFLFFPHGYTTSSLAFFLSSSFLSSSSVYHVLVVLR